MEGPTSRRASTETTSATQQQQYTRDSPFKYDIRVTGDLFMDDRDNSPATKVSVKIRGNEDGDVAVEQDDDSGAFSLVSPVLSNTDGETRIPYYTQKRGSDGGLELHIHALPAKRKNSSATVSLDGGGNSSDSETIVRRSLDTPHRHQLQPSNSLTSIPSTRASTRMDGGNSSPTQSYSIDQSFAEIRPAFEDNEEEQKQPARDTAVRTPESIERIESPALVGGGGRPRSASVSVAESIKKGDVPEVVVVEEEKDSNGLRTSNTSRSSIPVTVNTDDISEPASSRSGSSASSVLRGGGAHCRHSTMAADTSVFSAFNGPPAAPPESRISSTASRYHGHVRSRRSSKDKVSYRERAENLLTQYFPSETLEKYLSELRRRYRFIGEGGMTSSELAGLLDATTDDSRLKEQLRASFETLARQPPPPPPSSYHHGTSYGGGHSPDHHDQQAPLSPTSSSQPYYLSMRETELRDVLDRTSVSPVHKLPHSSFAPSTVLVGGGVSMEDMEQTSPTSQKFGTHRSDQHSVAESVLPAESEKGNGSKNTGPSYWDDNDKYKIHPPNMADAFTVLKSRPIVIREMSSSDVDFESPFARNEMKGGKTRSGEPTSPRNISELEEMLRKTKAERVANLGTENFHDRQSPGPTREAATSSPDSLVGGGASSRSESVHRSKTGHDETAVPVSSSSNYGYNPSFALSDSAISLPMRIEDMPSELASVLRRTGGITSSKIKRTETPTSVTSSTTSRGFSRATAPPAATSHYRSNYKSPTPVSRAATAAAAANGSRSMTELDIVMGRTGGPITQSALDIRSNTSMSTSTINGGVLSGGSGNPQTPSDNGNELANVLRRTDGYTPSVTDSVFSIGSETRPDSTTSMLKSVVAPETMRSTAAASGGGGGLGGNLRPSYGYSPQPPSRASARSPLNSGQKPGGYTSSPLSGAAYKKPAATRSPPLPHPSSSTSHANRHQAPRKSPVSPTPTHKQPTKNEAPPPPRSPSPELYRLPTPVFGRFPSPPAYIKNRGQNPDNDDDEEEGNGPPQQQSGRPHSHSVNQEGERDSARRYQEEPVVDRLDLETGSIASRRSRRSRPRAGSGFGSSSTLMDAHQGGHYDLPKVIEEDIDSLASYPMSGNRSPNLVGGGRLHPSSSSKRTAAAKGKGKEQEPSTLRGGGGHVHLASSSGCGGDAGCCGVCGKGVSKDDVVVRPQIMHASCLRCELCDCMLTSSTFCAINGHVYCESDYRRVVATSNKDDSCGLQDKRFQEINRAIMESFTSVDDFLQHLQQQRQLEDNNKQQQQVQRYAGDQSKVQRNGDVDMDRQTHYEREQCTTPSGTPWITERVVDKKTKTKVLEKRYPADSVGSKDIPVKCNNNNNSSTLYGGGGLKGPRTMSRTSNMDALRSINHSSASRPSTSLLNDTKGVNGWDQPLCPVCSHVIYPNDRVLHEGYGYHRTCMRCRQCSQVVPTANAIRIKGAMYCKKHGNELMRRRSILMRKKSTMGRRTRNNNSNNSRRREGVSVEQLAGSVGGTSKVPPVPKMPMYSRSNKRPSALPIPLAAAAAAAGSPGNRRVTSAMRNFLESAAEQIENQSLLPVTPNPPGPISPVSPTTGRRPLPQPKITGGGSHGRKLPVPPPVAAALNNKQQVVPKPLPSPTGTHRSSGSRSIFSGNGESRQSMYDPNVVNALRQEAQRQINGSQGSIAVPPTQTKQRLLSPCGPSIADALDRYPQGGGRSISMSSQFDPFLEASHEQLNHQQPLADANAQLDNLERRFRDANFKPPWALKSQSNL